jgi:hypothetical protein
VVGEEIGWFALGWFGSVAEYLYTCTCAVYSEYEYELVAPVGQAGEQSWPWLVSD